LEEFSNNPTLNDRIFKAFSRFFFYTYLHIDEENKKLKYESSDKDEEIKKKEAENEQLSEELKTLKENRDEDQELLDMIKIHSSYPDFVEITKNYMKYREDNPVYSQLVTKVMKFDFLSKKIGINK
jgi:predicted nuclease with TOPRIM domain